MADEGSLLIADAGALVSIRLTMSKEVELPTEFSLEQNYPNPFNPSTVIRYGLPTAQYVSLKVYDVLGQEAATLIEGMQEAGFKSVGWNAGALTSGLYYYRLHAGDFLQTRKLLLIK